MTTFTASGFSRRVDYGAPTLTYVDFSTATLGIVREDGDGDFVYSYGFIDETGVSPHFAQVFDPWSASRQVVRNSDGAITNLAAGMHIEYEVFAVTWAPGQTAYVFKAFLPTSGIEHVFFLGGAVPVIADADDLNSFLALPTEYILSGPFEGGNAIPLSGMAGVVITQDDRVQADTGEALFWNAGAGNDTILGSTGNDTLIGGDGNDQISGGGGFDQIWGAAGNDTVTTQGDGFIQTFGGAGDDVLEGGTTFGDAMHGGAGNDLITLSDGRLLGDVWVSHSVGNGGSGNDTITGGLGGDGLYGDAGNDVLSGGDGDDRMSGGGSADTLTGGNGYDTLDGGDGADRLSGGTLNDVLIGGEGNDNLQGEDNNDVLRGDAGNDTLSGGSGVDLLIGGAGADVLAGNSGADVFIYIAATDSQKGQRDTISGFQTGLDDIDLRDVFAATLTWVGNGPFTGAGQVQAVTSGSRTVVSVELTGDGIADMEIFLKGSTVAETDFLF